MESLSTRKDCKHTGIKKKSATDDGTYTVSCI